VSIPGADYTGHLWFVDQGNGQNGALMTSTGALYEQSDNKLSADTAYSAMGALSVSKGGYGTLSMWLPQPQPTLNITPITIGSGTAALDIAAANLYPGTEYLPTGIAADGGSNYYWANWGGGSGNLSTPVVPNIEAYTSNEDLISPYSTGYTGGSALMALAHPGSVHIDQSGNLWVVNQYNANNSGTSLSGGTYLGNGTNAGNVIEFVGLAMPVNPVYAQSALAGTNAMNAGASATSVMTTPGSYGNLP